MPCRDAALCFPLLFAALTGRSGHGLARRPRAFLTVMLPIRSASWCPDLSGGEFWTPSR